MIFLIPFYIQQGSTFLTPSCETVQLTRSPIMWPLTTQISGNIIFHCEVYLYPVSMNKHQHLAETACREASQGWTQKKIYFCSFTYR